LPPSVASAAASVFLPIFTFAWKHETQSCTTSRKRNVKETGSGECNMESGEMK